MKFEFQNPFSSCLKFYTDLTIKCRILSFYSAYSFVVVSALTPEIDSGRAIINFEIAMRHFKVQWVLFAR